MTFTNDCRLQYLELLALRSKVFLAPGSQMERPAQFHRLAVVRQFLPLTAPIMRPFIACSLPPLYYAELSKIPRLFGLSISLTIATKLVYYRLQIGPPTTTRRVESAIFGACIMMKRFCLALMVGILGAGLFSSGTWAATYYIAPTGGSDTSGGGTIDHPFATFSFAIAQAQRGRDLCAGRRLQPQQ